MKVVVRIFLAVFIFLLVSMNIHLIGHKRTSKVVHFPGTVNKRQSSEFKILSYNVFNLPTSIFANHGFRLKQLSKFFSKITSEVDIIVIQEAFTLKYIVPLKQFFEGMKWSVVYADPSENNWTFINSGLFVASRYPFVHFESINFRSCVMFDCWSKKGALLVQVKKNNKIHTIVTTHLQDATFDLSGYTRVQQLKEIASLTKRYKNVVVVGDINLDPNRERDKVPCNYAKKMFGNVVHPALPTFEALKLDCAMGSTVKNVKRIVPSYDGFVSDHYPIIVTIVQ
jgi:endonuclease/exonuclease/phosphatase family metal-dependent hydrolase